MDALESRVVSSSSSTALYAKLQSLSEKLQLLEAQLAPTNVKGLRHSVDALAAAVDLQVMLHMIMMIMSVPCLRGRTLRCCAARMSAAHAQLGVAVLCHCMLKQVRVFAGISGIGSTSLCPRRWRADTR